MDIREDKNYNQVQEIFKSHVNVIRCQAPIMKISSSFIRKAIQDKKDVRYLLTPDVHKYVEEMNFYK